MHSITSIPPIRTTSVLGPPLSDEELLSLNRQILLETLQARGASRVALSYHGQGDDGCMQGVEVVPETIDLSLQVSLLHSTVTYGPNFERSVHQAFELTSLEAGLVDYAEAIVELHHSGYENNDGGEGEVVFDCTEGTVFIDHRDFYVESYQTVTPL